MLNASKLVCFAATANPTKALEFYRDTLGLPLVDHSPFAIVFDSNGTMLRVQKVQDLSPVNYTVLGWQVDDIRVTIEQLTARGVRFERYDGMAQNTQGIWTPPDGSRVAWFKDPDGNALSLTEFR
ncbi:MAG: VOC family protein [Planctomycetia bacterium]|nr:VOC family protein [Planctomycetia bacterium]